jgi:putative Ca2+/H+ antiporter (TMEM165/GDT1 family)
MSFLISFVSIFLAEIADKTMLITLSLAGQVKRKNLIIGILLFSILIMIIPVAIGAYLDRIFPLGTLSLASGIIFIIIGVFQLISGKEEEEEEKEIKFKVNEVIKVFLILSLAELGDKTQIATFSLSVALPNVFLIWLGATLGIFLPNLIVALVGSELLKKINQNIVKVITSSLFLLVGIYLILTYFGWIPKVF